MPILTAKIELEKRLKNQFPSTPIAFEAVSFTPPSDQLYLAVQMKIDRPDDPVLGSRYRRENLSFQVFVCGLTNVGMQETLTFARNISELYKRGTTIVSSNYRIQVFNTPQIAGSVVADNRVIVPVLIPVTVEVYN